MVSVSNLFALGAPNTGTVDCVQSSSNTEHKYSWVIAVLLCVAAAGISNLGLNLQKLAHIKRADKSATPKQYLFNRHRIS